MTANAMRTGSNSCERALFARERAFFVRIVMLRLMFGGFFDVLHCMHQMAVRNHGMMRCFIEISSPVKLRGHALVFRGVLQQFRGFQMMIDAFLRHGLG